MPRENRHRQSNAGDHSRTNRASGIPEPLLQQHGGRTVSRAGEEVGVAVNVVVSAAKTPRSGTERDSGVEKVLEEAAEERQAGDEGEVGVGKTFSAGENC